MSSKHKASVQAHCAGLLGLVVTMVALIAFAAPGLARADTVKLTAGLMLAHDVNHDLRGAAARSLAQLASPEDEALDQARRERIRGLLGEPGVVVSYGVLAGLFDAATNNGLIDEELLPAIETIAVQHPSRTMRVGAQTLLELLQRASSPSD